MKKKLLFLFSMMALLFAPFTLWAQEPEPDTEYEAALAAIGDGGNYFISTDVEGTKYYITASGKLTSVRADGCIFALSKVEGGAFKSSGYYIDGGGTRFTNAPLSSNQAVLNVANYSTTTNNRANWEAQVLFLKDGKYAIRATNAAYGESSWEDAGRVFFSWKVEDVAIPQYTYDQVYLWEFEAATPITVTYKLVESDGVTEVSSVAQKQEANSDVKIPTSLAGVDFNGGWTPYAYYNYAAEGTIGNADCTIIVTRTPASGVVHALTDLKNDKAYTIRCDRGALLTSGETIASTSHSTLHNAEPGKFAIISYEENYYLYSVADKKFVLNTGSLADMPSHGVFDAIQMTAQTAPYFLFTFKIDESTTYGLNTNGTGALKGCVINSWTTPDPGDQYYMVEAADFDATEAIVGLSSYFHPTNFVTYIVKDAEGKELFKSDPVAAIPGSKITTLPADYQRDFTTYDEVDVIISEENNDAVFTATTTFPFTVSSSVADAKWYNMTIRSEKWVAMDAEEPYSLTTDKDLDAIESQWAFTGNAYTGVAIYNKAAGADKTLTKDENNVVMRDGVYLWDIFKNSDGFVLREQNTANNFINDNGGKLKFWDSGSAKTDNGSTFRVQEVIPFYTITCADGIENGAVTADLAQAKPGTTVTLTITPADGYELDVLSVKAGEDDVEVGKKNTFVMPANNVIITATFKVQEWPKNITNEYLVNADLSTVDNGWTYYSDAFKYTDWKTDGDVPVVEFYSQWNAGNPVDITQKDFKFSQTITLPAGDYRIAVNAFYRNGNGDGTNPDKAWIFAGDKKQNVVALTSAGVSAYTGSSDLYKAANAFSKGDFSNAFDFSLPKDSTLEVGFQGFFNTSLSWCILGPVEIWQYSLENYLEAYREKVEDTKELINSGKKMGADELAALQASIVDESTFTLGAEVVAAIDVMNAAIEAANNSIVGYAQLAAALEQGEVYKAHSVDDEAKGAYDTAVADVKAAYEAATVADLAAAIETVNAALPALAKSQTLAGSDLTIFIVNPEVNGAEGWTCEKPLGGNGPMLGGNSFEYWAGNASDRANASFDYWQEITGLPNGVYSVSADMYNSLNDEGGAVFAASSGVYAAAGVNEAYSLVDVDGTELKPYTTDGVLVLDGKLRIGVKSVKAMAARWFVADNFKLTLVKPFASENAEYVNALAAIEDGANYCITTQVGEEKYYLTAEGTLTSDINEAGTFVFEKASQDGNPYEYGFLLNSQNNTRFSNPYSPSEEYLTNGSLNTTTNNRSDWDAQVFFMKDGKFAVRSTNAPSGDEGSWGWIGSAYWTVNQGEAGPLAEYSWDPNYVWNLEKNTLVDIACNLVLNDEIVATISKTVPAGFAPAVPTEFNDKLHGLYTLAADVETITTETTTVNFTAEWTGIFEFSADFDNAKWVNMDIRSGWVVSKCEDEPYTMNNNVAKVDLLKAEYQWAFLPVEGEPFQMTIINASAQGQSLAMVTPEEGDSYVALRDGVFKWEVFANNDGFVIRPVDGEGNENMWVNQSGGGSPTNPLSFWNSANGKTDNGSTFRVSEAPDATEAYLELLKASLAANEPNPVLAGAAVFQKPQAAYDTFKAAYDAQAAVAAKEDATLEEVQAAITALDAAVTTYDAVEVNKPEAGQLYMFQNKVNGGYMALVVDGENVEVRAIAGSQGFEFSETEGGYFIKNEIGSVGLVGNKLGGVEEPNMAIEAIPAELTEDGVLYYNIINLADGRAINGNKNLDKSCSFITTPKDNASWTIVKYEYVPVCLKSYDLALRDIAVSDWTTVTIADAEIINEAAGLLGAAPAELTYQLVDTLGVRKDYNGEPGEILFWVDYDGNKSNWGVNNKYYILYDAATPAITITQFGAEYGKTLKAVVRLANAAGDYVEFKLSETMADAPATKFLADYTKKGTVEVVLVPAANAAYDAVLSKDYNESEVSALIGNDWGAIYGVGAKVDGQETLTDAYSCTPYPGFWCLADGTADVWANGAFGVSLIADENWTTFHFSAWTKEAVTTPMTTTFYLVNEATKEYVAYVITLSVYNSIRDMQLDGKAEIYDLNGRKVSKIQRGGIYIVNGKRVAVK